MAFCSQIGEYCANDDCPVEDDDKLWYQDSKGVWKSQHWIEEVIEPGKRWRLTLSEKEM